MGKVSRDPAKEAATDLAFHLDSLARLRTKDERETYIDAFVLAMTPTDVDPEPWQRWLSGKEVPFDSPPPTRPETYKQALSRDLTRLSDAVRRAYYDTKKAHDTLERAQARVQEAEAALAQARAKDIASLYAAMASALRSHLGPVFAMGPAWTVMRAISATPHLVELEDMRAFHRSAEALSKAEESLSEERTNDTAKIMNALACWAGDFLFETDLRQAILAVIEKFGDREPPRSVAEVRSLARTNAIAGEVTADRDGILDGFEHD